MGVTQPGAYAPGISRRKEKRTMASINKVFLLGNLGRDPELKYTQNGKAVCTLSLATNESFGKGSERQERTEWHKVVCWEKTAEFCGQYLKKGRIVHVEGRIQTRKYTASDGTDRYVTEVVALRLQAVGPNGNDNGSGTAQAAPAPPQAAEADMAAVPFSDEEVPF